MNQVYVVNRHDDDGPSVMAINFSQKYLDGHHIFKSDGKMDHQISDNFFISSSPSIYKNPSKSTLLSKNRGFF